MRNAKGTTPTTKRSGKDDGSAAAAAATSSIDKTSGKKLKQARLSFKIIAPGAGPSAAAAAEGKKAKVNTTVADADDAVEEVQAKCSDEQSAPRKRKLSYGGEDEAEAAGSNDEKSSRRRSSSKENLVVSAAAAAAKKKKLISEGDSADVVDDDVVLLDDDDDKEDEREKETLTKKREKEEENKQKVASNAKKSPKLSSPKTFKTPKESNKNKTKKLDESFENTPNSTKPSGSNGSASKLQIKLPLSSSKNKRRKSKPSATSANADKDRKVSAAAAAAGDEEEEEEETSADDLELIAGELNPQKRAKLDKKIAEEVRKNKEKCDNKSADKIIETINLESEDESVKAEAESIKKPTAAKDSKEAVAEKDSDSKSPKSKKSSLIKLQTDEKPKVSKAPLTDNEADDEEEDKTVLEDDNVVSLDSSASSNASAENVLDTTDNEIPPSSSSNAKEDEGGKEVRKSHTQTPSSKSESILAGESKKPLTPKQVKLLEQRRQAREDKERKLNEERLQKQREKEDKEQARKREREEKEEVRRKEREERDDQKRKEREEKERQRLAESEAKNEEKRKRNEAKEEELRKKEDERKRKEQEKEQAEAKKKKAAAAFTKFFVPKKGSGAEAGMADAATGEQDSAASLEQEGGGGVENAAAAVTLAFRPFQVKGDMKMAPICRKVFSGEARNKLDSFLRTFSASDDEEEEEEVVRTKPLRKPQLYLGELRAGTATPVKWRRPSNDAKVNADDDVLIIEDDLERAGQAITEETHRPVERIRAKFYKFHENRRPPFFGTWRKKTSLITPRRPLGQDKKYFDYEIDSDLEWEEEEPGESLDGGSDDDKEKESGDDEDYEVDNEWFVPHGHLSDEELEQQNEEEGVGGGADGEGGVEIGDSNTREAQKAKLKLLQQEFAQEMKKKTEKIKPRLVGCIWANALGQQPELCPNIIWETMQLRAMLPMEAPPLVEEPTLPDSEKTEAELSCGGGGGIERTAEKIRPIALSDRMLQDLVRLVHGNQHSKMFLIKEFIAFIEANEDAVRSGNARGPLKSAVREKIDEYAVWKATEAAAVESVSGKKKNKLKKRLRWIVSAETLQRMDLSTLDFHNNSWKYTLQPRISASTSTTTATEKECSSVGDAEADNADERLKEASHSVPAADAEVKGKRNFEITRFTKVLTAAEKAAQLKVTASQPKLTASAAASTKTKTTPAAVAAAAAASPAAAVKKRVPLLMSVARGAQIPTSAKNALISQFLKKPTTTTTTTKTAADSSENDKNATPPPSAPVIPMETEIIVLE